MGNIYTSTTFMEHNSTRTTSTRWITPPIATTASTPAAETS